MVGRNQVAESYGIPPRTLRRYVSLSRRQKNRSSENVVFLPVWLLQFLHQLIFELFMLCTGLTTDNYSKTQIAARFTDDKA